MQRVGWGRASAKDIQAMSLLHARLFDVFARSAYMAPRVGGLIARAIATDLSQPKAPAVRVYVGHDNTIAAVTAILGVHFTMPGYGADDPPIGGGLLFERLTDRRTHNHVIRLSYVAQTPSAARHLSIVDSAVRLSCGISPSNGAARLARCRNFRASLNAKQHYRSNFGRAFHCSRRPSIRTAARPRSLRQRSCGAREGRRGTRRGYAWQDVVGRQDAAEGGPHRGGPHHAAERMAVIPN